MSISEKELMSKRAIHEEAKMRLSLQSINDQSPSPENNQRSQTPVDVRLNTSLDDLGVVHKGRPQK